MIPQYLWCMSLIKDDIMIFTVATQLFSGTIDNMASDVSTDIPSGKFNSVRFDIDAKKKLRL